MSYVYTPPKPAKLTLVLRAVTLAIDEMSQTNDRMTRFYIASLAAEYGKQAGVSYSDALNLIDKFKLEPLIEAVSKQREEKDGVSQIGA